MTRMAKVFLLVWLLLALISQADAEPLFVSKCVRLDSCSVSKLVAKDIAGTSNNGVLFKLLLQGGEIVERKRRRVIKWNEQRHTVYVYCSKRIPTTIVRRDDDGLEVTPLNIGTGVPMVLLSDLEIYAKTCHDLDGVVDEMDLAKRFGYSVDRDAIDKVEKQIKEPIDILKY
jgi:hypothetical protein